MAEELYTRYVIQRGDTLIRIAEKHGTTVAKLAEINDIENPSKILAGKAIFIPAKK